MDMRAAYVTVALLAVTPVALSVAYWRDSCSYRLFGSKTPYDDVRGDIRDIPHLDGCEPISVWAMMRHGTRHPGSDDIENMKNVMAIKEDILEKHHKGLGELCAQDITNLKNWTWNEIIDSTPSELTDEGYQELFELGTRLHEKLNSLLISLDEYDFRPSTEQRTKMSAKAFTEGLGSDTLTFNVSEPLEKDYVVRPYKLCDKREKEVINGPHIQNEMNKYYETKEFKQMLTTVQKRIGVDQEITPKIATGLYDLCRFYRAYSSIKRSPWCAVFSNPELEIMEYIEDVRHYYRNGYGGGLVNVKLGELALKDLFEKFNSENKRKSITGYFTHDTMLQMVYSALGLYNDYPQITGYERVTNRQWRSSFNVPFAANIIALLHRCKSAEDESFKVQFFVNELELRLCKDRACTWEEFTEKFGSYASSDLEFCYSKS